MSTKTFEERLTEDRRLVILRVLNEQIEYRANSSVITVALNHFGHSISRDQVKTELHWLAEQRLLTIDDIGPVIVATLGERGQDVARGRAIVPGVSRPGS
ncbi:ArsR family transcriptional regulator [Tahibacter soli]|uniref:ArsR family transcriptional regulator n=1 Tax=Tahibacter soli TaxID=2983605 RepID=A0A9X3YIC9_9GAMM|nr:ArsR family transcriptional regulator [Tahibacter soli]MDC8012924.1 ArsR family transcriptional regulator [Tahibacter soli]